MTRPEDHPVTETTADFREFGRCGSPDCLRKVSRGSRWCCTSCTQANGRYELDPFSPGLHWTLTHSAGCEQRAAERGQWTVFEADAAVATQVEHVVTPPQRLGMRIAGGGDRRTRWRQEIGSGPGKSK
jgi:hypothetical protein